MHESCSMIDDTIGSSRETNASYARNQGPYQFLLNFPATVNDDCDYEIAFLLLLKLCGIHYCISSKRFNTAKMKRYAISTSSMKRLIKSK